MKSQRLILTHQVGIFESFIMPFLAVRVGILLEDKMEEWRTCEMRWWVIIYPFASKPKSLHLWSGNSGDNGLRYRQFQQFIYPNSVILHKGNQFGYEISSIVDSSWDLKPEMRRRRG